MRTRLIPEAPLAPFGEITQRLGITLCVRPARSRSMAAASVQPDGRTEAAAMLRDLAGRTHSVIPSLWVISPNGARGASGISRVRMAPLSEAQIAAYVASREPFGKAGAYGIQGRAG